MLTVQHLLVAKPSVLYAIGSDEPVLAAIQKMADCQVGALLVMRGEELQGIVSERDYARKVILRGRSSAETAVWEIMSSPVITVAPEDSIEACMRLCTEHHIRHLPVVQEGKVAAMLSIGDLVKAVISEQSTQLELLQRYISG